MIILGLGLGAIGCLEHDPFAAAGIGLGQGPQIEPVSLTFFFPYGSTGLPDDDEFRLVLDEIERRSRSALNVKLDFQWFTTREGEYNEKVRTTLASTDPLEGFLANLPNAGGLNLAHMARLTQIKDLTESLPRLARDLFNRYQEEELSSVSVDGKIFAVPPLRPLSHAVYALVREDLKKSYGIGDIETLDDFETYLAVIKENESDLTAGKIAGSPLTMFPGLFGYVFLDAGRALVYRWDDPEMRIRAWEKVPEADRVFDYLIRWKEQGYLHYVRRWVRDWWSHCRNRLVYGQVASLLADVESVAGRPIDVVVAQLNEEIRTSVGPYARIKAYQLYPEQVSQRINPAARGALVFSETSPEVDRALMFIGWIHESQDNYDLIAYGIEGRHYRLKGKRYGVSGDGRSTAKPHVDWYGMFLFADTIFERFPYTHSGYPSQAEQRYKEFLATRTRYPPHLGFYPDYSSVRQEADQRTEMYNRQILRHLVWTQHAFTKQDLEFYKNRLEYIGHDKVIQSLQSQLDRWRLRAESEQARVQ